MSKNSKTRSKEKRMKEKKARKEAQKAKYQAFRDAGQNKKSKRSVKAGRKTKVSTINHPFGRCYNIGCDKCFGVRFSTIFFQNGKPHGMPHKIYMKWKAAA